MRAFLNAILSFLGAASLTDVEFDALSIETYGYDAATYNALLAVVDGRESVSDARDRLRYFFLAKGIVISESSSGKSNILIGFGLCD